MVRLHHLKGIKNGMVLLKVTHQHQRGSLGVEHVIKNTGNLLVMIALTVVMTHRGKNYHHSDAQYQYQVVGQQWSLEETPLIGKRHTCVLTVIKNLLSQIQTTRRTK